MTVWTIGHSTHTLDDFLKLLKAHSIQGLADIRRFPASRRYPHFNKAELTTSLQDDGINYWHFEALGGRRTPAKDSRNNGWRNASFRGYADYMETDVFTGEIAKLETLARNQRVAYMCSEAVWWSCHRSLVSDFLKVRGWTVLHIVNSSKADEHPWTSPAKVKNGQLSYSAEASLDL